MYTIYDTLLVGHSIYSGETGVIRIMMKGDRSYIYSTQTAPRK